MSVLTFGLFMSAVLTLAALAVSARDGDGFSSS
jgi:hypothetical protein